MEKVSLEYCHVYVGHDIKKEVEDANFWAPRMLKMFDQEKVQKCIMLDDIHAKREVDDSFVQELVESLTVKPDCIYRESEFIAEAHKMVEAINPSERDGMHPLY